MVDQVKLRSASQPVVLDDDLVIAGDNLPVLSALPAATFDLIYMDPPFNTGRAQTTLIAGGDPRRRRRRAGGQDRLRRAPLCQQAAAEPQLRRRVRRLPRLPRAASASLRANCSRPHGTLYFHIDYREAHYCKLLLDEIFGRDAFLNELIWAYDYGAKPRRRWPAKHDTILVYVREPGAHHFDADAVEREPYMAPGLVSAEKAARGKRPTDVWFHTIVPTNGREKTGYPTQKPEGVLRRIVAASSTAGWMVPGSIRGLGHARCRLAKLGRRFVLVDSNPTAIDVMRERLVALTPASVAPVAADQRLDSVA